MKKDEQNISADQIFPAPVMEHIKDSLVDKGETIAVAESVTSGLLQLAFGTVKDASSFYQGGITAYNVGQKYRHLLIEPIHALECDCISQKVAEEMALQVCKLFKSNWGISITGYATGVEKADYKLFAYYAVAHDRKVVLSKQIKPSNTEPFPVQIEYASEVLKSLGELVR